MADTRRPPVPTDGHNDSSLQGSSPSKPSTRRPRCTGTTKHGCQCKRRSNHDWLLGWCWQHFKAQDLTPDEYEAHLILLERDREEWRKAESRARGRRGLYLVKGDI